MAVSILKPSPIPANFKINMHKEIGDVPREWNWDSSILSDKGQQNTVKFNIADMFSKSSPNKVVIPLMDAVQFTTAELTMIQNQIEAVQRRVSVLKRYNLISTLTVPAGVKTYTYYIWKDIVEPRITTTFEGGRIVHTAKSSADVTFIGFDYDVYFSMVELDQMNLQGTLEKHSESLMDATIREVMAAAAEYYEWMCHRGTDVPNIVDIDVNGIFNATGITDPGALGLGSDDNLTAFGDISGAALKMGSLLAIENKGRYANQKFYLLMTPGVFAQMIANINTSADMLPNDLTIIKESGLFSDIIVDPFLIDDTETTSTGAMAVMANDPENVIIEPRKLQYYEYPRIDFGRRGKILCEFGVKMAHPEAIVYADSLTTAIIS